MLKAILPSALVTSKVRKFFDNDAEKKKKQDERRNKQAKTRCNYVFIYLF